jgi:hypothetical protein
MKGALCANLPDCKPGSDKFVDGRIVCIISRVCLRAVGIVAFADVPKHGLVGHPLVVCDSDLSELLSVLRAMSPQMHIHLPRVNGLTDVDLQKLMDVGDDVKSMAHSGFLRLVLPPNILDAGRSFKAQHARRNAIGYAIVNAFLYNSLKRDEALGAEAVMRLRRRLQDGEMSHFEDEWWCDLLLHERRMRTRRG